jgi:hypothetical protein
MRKIRQKIGPNKLIVSNIADWVELSDAPDLITLFDYMWNNINGLFRENRQFNSTLSGNNVTTSSATGLLTGDKIFFLSMVSNPGITIRQPYYIVNIIDNLTFQISDSLDGLPISFATDGEGIIVRKEMWIDNLPSPSAGMHYCQFLLKSII